MVPSVGIAPTYQVLQTCANLSQLTWRILLQGRPLLPVYVRTTPTALLSYRNVEG
jgi:hypothetical protein